MANEKKYDVAIVGAGIVGLGAAWASQKSGASVVVIESSPQACGASIRNFGMIWPLGQPIGLRRSLAMRNRQLWIELATKARLHLEECGSLHLTHHADERQVLEEFADLDDSDSVLLNAVETQKRTACANPNGLLASLWSPIECRVDPREAIAKIPTYLEKLGIDFQFGRSAQRIEEGGLTCSDGSRWSADRIIVCSGAKFASLYPREHSEAGMKLCKLQMMRTVPQPSGFQLGPHLASGLTLRHYESFAICPSLEALKKRVSESQPELDRYGIHVMASQYNDGQIILGDSHLYDSEITPFRSEEIDRLMLQELAKVYHFPNWTIDERWTGIYAKQPHQAWLHRRVSDQVEIINGFGGSGMSMSLGVTESILASTNSANESLK